MSSDISSLVDDLLLCLDGAVVWRLATVNGSSKSTSIGIITYIGVGISIPCLLIALIAEAVIWKSVTENDTTYMRHVCLVNITVSLLLAEIWFIIYIVLLYFPNPKLYFLDLAANILLFFFYLCLCFWILVIGLFLFYRVIFVLHNMSRRAMLTAAFSVGYGCPILITTILFTAVVPREAFKSRNETWFETDRTRAIISFLVPVMTISFLNLIILLVVIYKIIRSPEGVKRRFTSRKILIQIISIIAVLTPVSSITWGISLRMLLDKNNLFLQNLYFAFHAFQGVFIMLFNVLPNQRVRKALRALCGNCLPSKQESQTVIESLRALCGNCLPSKQESQTVTLLRLYTSKMICYISKFH
uniref:G-protein coupled receptors family 2 profile 2 domain-containing protein n=1 Tax=Xenopus tropicalis TaxID=8364 RepID=A0A803JMT3_XENTR